MINKQIQIRKKDYIQILLDAQFDLKSSFEGDLKQIDDFGSHSLERKLNFEVKYNNLI